jgi:hypothetical protein
MTEPKYVTLPTREKVQEAKDAYVLAVGRVSGAWNYLHQTLGEFFAVVIGGDAELVVTAWRSLENDRAQREMLRAAIKAASPKRWKQTPKAPDESALRSGAGRYGALRCPERRDQTRGCRGPRHRQRRP